MSFIKVCTRCFCALFVLISILLYAPDIPPHVTFSSYEVDPALPREGPLAKNFRLSDVERIHEGLLLLPESIASRAENEIFVSLHNGDIARIWGHDFEKTEVVANLGPGCVGSLEEYTCGRPLGMRFAKDKRLVITEAYSGIFALDTTTGEKERLVDPDTSIEDVKPHIFDDLDIDDNGNIYWVDSSTVSHLAVGLIEVLSDPSGRLIMYNPQTKHSTVLLSELHFPGGVQLSPDQEFVLVSEFIKFRIIRYWLKGPKAGSSDVFISGLPGMPDNLKLRKGGGYYVPLITSRHHNVTNFFELMLKMPRVKKVITRAAALLQKVLDFINFYFPNNFCEISSRKIFHLEALSRWFDNEAMIVEVDDNGKIVGSLQGSKGVLKSVSEAQQIGDYLFFASPYSDFLGRLHIGKRRKPMKLSSKTKEKETTQKEEL